MLVVFFFQAEDGIRDVAVTGVQTCALPISSTSFPYAIYDDICARNQTFSSLAAFAGNGSQLNVGYKGQPGRADGELVSGTFFSTLGVPPILGRLRWRRPPRSKSCSGNQLRDRKSTRLNSSHGYISY